MRLKLGECPDCGDGVRALQYDGDVVCTRCAYRERAPDVRRVTLSSFSRRSSTKEGA